MAELLRIAGLVAGYGEAVVVRGIDLTLFARYVAPLTEEISKAVFVGLLLWRNRVGFLVDAAVQGFAVGTGFALVENIDYLRHLGDAGGEQIPQPDEGAAV